MIAPAGSQMIEYVRLHLTGSEGDITAVILAYRLIVFVNTIPIAERLLSDLPTRVPPLRLEPRLWTLHATLEAPIRGGDRITCEIRYLDSLKPVINQEALTFEAELSLRGSLEIADPARAS